MEIKEVIYKYFPKASDVSFKQYKNGAINITYHIFLKENNENKEFILQKMSNIFDPSIMEDIDFITKYLISKDILTQQVVKTINGNISIIDEKGWWRMLTYIPGKSFSVITSLPQAKEAGKLLGNFHNALMDCDYNFKFKLPHYHDVIFTMEKLTNLIEDNKNTNKYENLKNVITGVLSSYKELSFNADLPKHIIHNDLKISNIIFNEDNKAVALIDLDTLSYGTIAIEMGDAMRSWCIVGGEDSLKIEFNINVYNTALEGYFSTALFLTASEKESIPYGVSLMALDLSARFIIDAFEENYFILDSSKYKNLFEQNKRRAENQFEFFKEFLKSSIFKLAKK